jgi:hypothetical protein
MPSNDDELRAIWQSQYAGAQPMTPEQLRARAERLESKARRNVRLNQISAALLAACMAFGLFVLDRGLLFKIGTLMLLVASIYIAWGMSYFFSALPIPTGASPGTCAVVHKRQLQRQRDLNLSIRSGARITLPGAILVLVGPFWPNSESYVGPEAWAWPFALVVIALFVFQAAITYGEIVADRFQREIDELDSMTKDAPAA